ncbi:MAG: hypothetical protein SF029_05755 [bacterium]|nr:hypothetical protein [bacterium]
MAEQGYAIEQDLKEAEAMAKSLVPYVHEEPLYGQAGGGGFFSKLPSLTVGALLMRLRRLEAQRDTMTPAQQSRLDAVQTRHSEVLKEWRMHYEKKMLREANSRLDAMGQFFEECNQNPRSCAGNYGVEASRRTIVQELVLAMQQMGIADDDLQTKLRAVDGKLRRYVQPSDFVWDASLQPYYPQRDFWWLYTRPQAQ